MGRPTTKQELLTAARVENERLWALIDGLSAHQRERSGVCGEWSVKDLLAHVAAWHELFLGWESEGRSGGRPAMPAPGYAWVDVPHLNEVIHRRHADDAWDEVVARLRRTHAAVLAVIESYEDDELFAKARFAWTGVTSVGSYATSATVAHDAWVRRLVAAWMRSLELEAA